MGKRSNFKRRKNDLYRTPFGPVLDLKPHLPERFRFAEVCAGNGQLIDYLQRIGGVCSEALDINPARGDIQQGDASRWVPTMRHYRPLDYIITNPPWTRQILHLLIRRLSWIAPTWLLFDADWVHTKQAAPFSHLLSKVVSVGRVKWFPNSKMMGKDNCAWHLFDRKNSEQTKFYGRVSP